MKNFVFCGNVSAAKADFDSVLGGGKLVSSSDCYINEPSGFWGPQCSRKFLIDMDE